MNRSELVSELHHLSENIQRNINNRESALLSMSKLNNFLMTNSGIIVSEMESMFQDLASLKLQLNEKTETIKQLTRP